MLELSGTGDDGTTGLLGGGRAPKDDPRIEAFGTVDEASSALDLARAITRRAERRCVTLERAGGLPNPDVRRWLNRLSLLLFVLGRYEESVAGKRPEPAKRAGPGRSS